MLSANLCLWQVHHEMLVPRGPDGDDSNMGLVSVVFDPSSLCHTRSSQTSGPIIPCLVCGVCVVLVSCLAFISFPSEAAATAAQETVTFLPECLGPGLLAGATDIIAIGLHHRGRFPFSGVSCSPGPNHSYSHRGW